jgi:glutathione peroxidase-family protein
MEFHEFLIDKAGVVRARFAPMTKPERLVRAVAALL